MPRRGYMTLERRYSLGEYAALLHVSHPTNASIPKFNAKILKASSKEIRVEKQGKSW